MWHCEPPAVQGTHSWEELSLVRCPQWLDALQCPVRYWPCPKAARDQDSLESRGGKVTR